MAKFNVTESSVLAKNATIKAFAAQVVANANCRTKLQQSGLPVYNGQIIKSYEGLSLNDWTNEERGTKGSFVVAVLKDDKGSTVRVPLTMFVKEGDIIEEDRSQKHIDRIEGGIGDIIFANSDLAVSGAIEAIDKGFTTLLKSGEHKIIVKTEVDYLRRGDPRRFHTINLI